MDAAAGPLVRAQHDLNRGRPERALAALEQVTGGELESVRYWRLRALALFSLRRWDETADAAQQGLERSPNDTQLLEVLALAHSSRRKKKEALSAIDTAIALNPDDPGLHAQRAVILARNAANAIGYVSYRKARAAANHALQLDPDSTRANQARAHVALLAGERRAHAFAARALSLDPDDEYAHRLYGTALTSRGRVGSGLKHYAEAARIDPESPDAARLLKTTKGLRHFWWLPMRLLWRLGPLPVLSTLFVLVIASLALYLATGTEAPLAILGVLFIPFFWYLVIVGLLAQVRRF